MSDEAESASLLGSSKRFHSNFEKSLYVVYLLNVPMNFAFFIQYPALWPYIVTITPWDNRQTLVFYGWCVACFSISFALSCVWVPHVASKTTYKFACAHALIVGLIGNFLYSIAVLNKEAAVWLVLFGRILIGYSAGVIPVSINYVIMVTSEKERTSKILNVTLSQIVSSIIGPGVFTGLAYVDFKVIGFPINPGNSPGIISALLYIVSIIMLLLLFKNPPDKNTFRLSNNEKDSESAAINDSDNNNNNNNKMNTRLLIALVTLCINMFSLFAVYAGMESVIVPLVESYYNWPLWINAVMFVALGLIAFIDYIAMRTIFKSISESYLLLGCILLLLLGSLLLNDLSKPPLDLWRFIIGQVFLALATAPGMTVIQSIQSKIYTNGIWSGLLVAIIAVGRVLGPVIVTSTLRDSNGYRSNMISCTILAIISFISMLFTLSSFSQFNKKQS